ncbi:Isonitrile hydratase [Thalassoglobus neptunius]|uniref:Isonitrile hydratase n=1 Tax=Thalassoglobus neptunius TaxID=1938619 RepID=A0A5C5X1C6_9PLAN|nr:cupin domain-containing protein [Thalassoglobus neptunius]TWT56944.1 Isonitrile hydratase [Thalassoglobus neptunius]
MTQPVAPMRNSLSRVLLSCFVATALSVASAHAEEETTSQPSQSTHAKVLGADNLKGLQDGKMMTASLLEVTVPPLGFSPPHRHPGSVTGYVLEGTLEFAVEDEPIQTLKAGDTFFEPKMILHRVSRNPDKTRPCRFLVTMVHPADAKQLVIPENDSSPVSHLPQEREDVANETCTISVSDSVNRQEFDETLPTIGILLFDNVLMTEVTAPIDVFTKPDKDGNRLFNVITVSESIQPVPMESGLRVLPDFTFDDCPKLNVLVVSSSYDMERIVASERIGEFVRSKGKSTDYTMSNCAGAHLIGESGIADGRRIVTYIGGGDLLQKTCPSLAVQDDNTVSFVKDGRLLSSNGNLASYISALKLLEELTDKQHRDYVEEHLYLQRLQDYEPASREQEIQ